MKGLGIVNRLFRFHFCLPPLLAMKPLLIHPQPPLLQTQFLTQDRGVFEIDGNFREPRPLHSFMAELFADCQAREEVFVIVAVDAQNVFC